MTKEETLKNILDTITHIKEDKTDDLTSTTWKHMYLRDTSYLLKQLSAKIREKKDLLQTIEDNKSITRAGLTNIDKIVQDLKRNMSS